MMAEMVGHHVWVGGWVATRWGVLGSLNVSPTKMEDLQKPRTPIFDGCWQHICLSTLPLLGKNSLKPHAYGAS